ncbi:DUF4180 domain-containing protein [Vibrio ulleungensis]|uniref:DUF4180 domain-containing protein n=1 Tax=Vibrio ulleungensis TaxID=2807619 RepID=A0ABS2HM70_9VIBR|nr:DUF4180 domain-containing protein [Vibrio ulleungensis]MBM7037154.1 DUF4180 domain-containing protein [Vibrio ulleungensis]
MEIKLINIDGVTICEVSANGTVVNNLNDALDLIGNVSYQGSRKLVVRTEHLAIEFFDLKTKLAGEILQKFSNYDMQLAIVGENSHFNSTALKSFIVECNRGNRILFEESREVALEALAKC